MDKDKYPMYGIALIAGGALAWWAGLPASLLLFLVVCPLMMFLMMRGMHGGQQHQDTHGGHDEAGLSSREMRTPTGDRRPGPDGSHERIDQP